MTTSIVSRIVVLAAGMAVLTGQNARLLFDDIKLYYQRPGETKFRDDKGVLVLDGTQKVVCCYGTIGRC